MFTLNCKGRLLRINQPIVMGIINTTPDSFYAGSRQQGVEAALQQASRMIEEGATVLDIGGQSTRPGSERISVEEELQRVVPVIAAVHQRFPDTFISCDTFYATVAREAVKSGASLINDISAGSIDPDLISTVASLQVPYVLMHMKGNPQTMQQETHYTDLTTEVLDFLIQKKQQAIAAGIRDIIIDPGFGFAKTFEQNFILLRNLSAFSILEAPLLLGISRKSFIWKTLGITAAEALEGTVAMHMAGLMGGASILRVHDVKEAVQTIRLFQAMREA